MKRRLPHALALIASLIISPAFSQQVQPDSRVALLIANASYPDAPLATPVKDARSLGDELKRNGFEVDIRNNLGKEDMQRALDAFTAKIKKGSTALFFFSGFGVQVSRQSYLIPTNAQIWTEAEVRRDGTSIDSVLAQMNQKGADVKIVIIDASRRNPYERRFRAFSSGLAALDLPDGSLAMYSAATEKVANDTDDANSVFVRELLKEIRSPGGSAEAVFNRTRFGVSRASNGEQVPWVSSSLVGEYAFGSKSSAPPGPADASVSARVTPDSSPNLNSPNKPVVKALVEDPSIKTLDTLLQNNPNDATAFSKRGRLYAKNGDFPRAVIDFDQAIRLDPNYAEAFNDRCWSRAMFDDLKLALRDCNEALRLRPGFADALDSRGLVYLKLGLIGPSIADYNAALQIRPNQASSLYGRGLGRLRIGNAAEGNNDIAAAKAISASIADEFAGYGVR